MTATHNGTCQACGREHALTKRGLAKHGYTVDWGYFNGTCSGSDKAPLELDTSYNEKMVVTPAELAEAIRSAHLGFSTLAPEATRALILPDPHPPTYSFDLGQGT